MLWQFEGIMPDGKRCESRVCPATPHEHEIAALRARNAELEAKYISADSERIYAAAMCGRLESQLSESIKREVALREALERISDRGPIEQPEKPTEVSDYSHGQDYACAREEWADWQNASIAREALADPSTAATQWLQAHDREMLEKVWNRPRHN
jgi:hypothetical protein